MRYIFILDLKKAIRSRKNWLVLLLYTMLLVIFAASNMADFDRARNNEILQLDYLYRINQNTSNRLNEMLVIREVDMHVLGFHSLHSTGYHTQVANAMKAHADSTKQFSVHIADLIDAIQRNDRTAEVEIYNKTLKQLYTDILESSEWRGIPVPWPFGPLVEGPAIDFDEWDEYNRVNYEFLTYLIENNIHYLYRNEMTGFNFLYQVMQRFLPYVALIFVFLTICDVFTQENETGSYKFLLLQPVSRIKIYIIKLLFALVLAFLMLMLPLLLLFFVFGFFNGFGSPDYPVLIHAESYITLTPLQNHLFVNERRGFLFYNSAYFGSVQVFTDHGYGYVTENASLGISTYSLVDETVHSVSRDHPFYDLMMARREWTPWRAYTSTFVPNDLLTQAGMLSAILMTLPLYLALMFFTASVSALIGVISQNSTISLTISTLIGAAAILFPNPIRAIPIFARSNPFVYINPLNIINGLGSTTALTGAIVLIGIGFMLTAAGIFIFSRRDIKC